MTDSIQNNPSILALYKANRDITRKTWLNKASLVFPFVVGMYLGFWTPDFLKVSVAEKNKQELAAYRKDSTLLAKQDSARGKDDQFLIRNDIPRGHYYYKSTRDEMARVQQNITRTQNLSDKDKPGWLFPALVVLGGLSLSGGYILSLNSKDKKHIEEKYPFTTAKRLWTGY